MGGQADNTCLPSYVGYRLPAEIVSRAVWLYFRFPLSLRVADDLLAARVMITDKLRSYAAAKRELMPSVEHRKHKDLNDSGKDSHQPTRRKRQMKRFKSVGQVQCFLSAYDGISNLFHLRRDCFPADQY